VFLSSTSIEHLHERVLNDFIGVLLARKHERMLFKHWQFSMKILVMFLTRF